MKKNVLVVNNPLGVRVWFAWGGKTSKHEDLDYLVSIAKDKTRRVYLVNDTLPIRLTEEQMQELNLEREHRFVLDLTEITNSRLGKRVLDGTKKTIEADSMEYDTYHDTKGSELELEYTMLTKYVEPLDLFGDEWDEFEKQYKGDA